MSQFDESKVKRDDSGKFAEKPPAPESGVSLDDRITVIESPDYQRARDELRADPIIQSMADDLERDFGSARGGLDFIRSNEWGFTQGALSRYNSQGGQVDSHIGGPAEAVRAELEERAGGPAPVDDGAPLSQQAESTMKEVRRGEWTISDAQVVDEDSDDPRIVRQQIHLGGVPHVRAANMAAAEIYREIEDPEVVRSKIDQLAAAGKPMTVLTASKAGTIRALEGRGFVSANGRTALLGKGSRTRGYYVDDLDVIDVTPGYGGQKGLDETWRRRMATHVPRVTPVGDLSDVPDVGDNAPVPDRVAAVYMIDHPGFGGGRESGCLFMATDRQTGDGGEKGDIVNGYFWAPGRSHGQLTSETSSMYSSDLKARGGQVADYRSGSMKFSDCWKDMPDDAGEGYRRVLGRSWRRD